MILVISRLACFVKVTYIPEMFEIVIVHIHWPSLGVGPGFWKASPLLV